MKKKFYFFAVSAAMLLTACSSEEVTNGVTDTSQATPMAVGFDIYASSATRAGDAGIQTTATIQAAGKGFGVFAQYSNNGSYSNTTNPTNFMWNQHVTYSASAWTYSPLKYWPNETLHDSQTETGAATSTDLDQLSFFAYAPYVAEQASTYSGVLNGIIYAAGPEITDSHLGYPTYKGISSIISNNSTGNDPWVRYEVASKPSESVDLIWGVAPAGGLSYKAVHGSMITISEGMPLVNLVKPAKDQKIKFLFKHALARLGLTVVAAIDQIAPGGVLDAKTKILIKSIKITESTTHLGISGALSLKNTSAGVALWPNKTSGIDFTIDKDNELAEDLQYETNAATSFIGSHKGVTTTEKTVIAKTGDPAHDNYFMVIPGHANTQLKVVIDYCVITKDEKVAGGYSEVENVITKEVVINNLTNNKAYNLKLILGMTSVKLDAEVADWQVDGSTDVNLPRNNE